nr:MAG TPA: hypothetical protein [Bacteriophage sp.]
MVLGTIPLFNLQPSCAHACAHRSCASLCGSLCTTLAIFNEQRYVHPCTHHCLTSMCPCLCSSFLRIIVWFIVYNTSSFQ